MDATTRSAALLRVVHDGLKSIGYRDELLRRDYRFADVLDEAIPQRDVTLAAFGQEPPSYRSACFGVVMLDRYDAQMLQGYRALGAPQLLVLSPDDDIVRRWRMTASGEPRFIESIAPEQLGNAFATNRKEWSPETVLRAKAIGFARGPVQLDFFDTGLLPTLEGITHQKLDRLLRDVIATSEAVYAEHSDNTPDYQGLFRLIFRFVAAKMLADRGYPGDDWLDRDPDRVIAAVDAFYFRQAPDDALPQDRAVRRAAWEHIRSAFLFQNLSVEALAYVYENTLVSKQSRNLYDTHATPPQIAEYIVQQLPFEQLQPDERRVFEPFAGHAPFLIAALGRLRTLLPETMSSDERHRYFVRMLSGMELDAFAREVARYSLILADYPNPDGWDILLDNVFTSPHTDDYLRRATTVLCNPPYSDAPARGQSHDRAGAAKRAVEALNRVTQQPPVQLGFVLPKAFVSGQEYREARRRIAAAYREIDIITLPDTVFQYSQVETVLLTAHGVRDGSSNVSVAEVSAQDYDRFIRTGAPTWRVEWPISLSSTSSDAPTFWRTPLWQAWDALEHLPRLGDLADVHRGIQYRPSLRTNRAMVVRSDSNPGFAPGLLNISADYEPYVVGTSSFLNTDSSVMFFETHKLPWDKPKVITNAARLSRGPWRIAAVIDREGLICYQAFHGIWPLADMSLEILAAILNSPLANAFLFNHPAATQRHNQIRALEQIPVPSFTPPQVISVKSLVNQYERLRQEWGTQPERGAELEDACRELLIQIDAEVLGAYNLPPRLEKQLLDTFSGHQRPGPVQFTGYYPPGYRPAIPWRIFISEGFQSADARATLARLPVLNDPVISAAVRDLDDDILDDDERNADA